MIMHDLFGGVVYAGIDTDRYKYPIGSGRVTFGSLKSFMKAVKAGFVEIKTPKFSKKVRGELHECGTSKCGHPEKSGYLVLSQFISGHFL